MFANVVSKTLRDQRRGLIGWGIGIAVLVGVMAAMWPSVRGIPDLEQFVSKYPEALRKLFQMDAIATGTGYLNIELFSMMLPALFVVYGVGRGARLVAGEEEAGDLEVVLVTPVSRRRLLMGKAGALAASMLGLGAVLFVVTVAASTAAGMHAGAGQIAGASAAMVLIGLEYGWLALAVGAATGRRSAAVAAGAVAAVAGYVVFMLGRVVDAVGPWAVVSPFHQALVGGPLGSGFPARYGWMALGAVAVLALAVPAFDRRDVRA